MSSVRPHSSSAKLDEQVDGLESVSRPSPELLKPVTGIAHAKASAIAW